MVARRRHSSIGWVRGSSVSTWTQTCALVVTNNALPRDFNPQERGVRATEAGGEALGGGGEHHEDQHRHDHDDDADGDEADGDDEAGHEQRQLGTPEVDSHDRQSRWAMRKSH